MDREMLDQINTILCQSWFGYGWEFSHLDSDLDIVCKTIDVLPHILF